MKEIPKPFYANDVDSITQKAGGVTSQEKNNVYLMIVIMANLFGIFALPKFLIGFGIDLFGSIIVQITLNVAIAIPIFRIFIFKEKDRIREYESYSQDSFSKFFKVNKGAQHIINVLGYGEVEIFEYNNGIPFCVLQFKYGSNNDDKKVETNKTFSRMAKYLCEQEMQFVMVESNENFRESQEFKNYIKKANTSEYKDLMLKIFNNALDYSEDSIVNLTTFIIRATKKHQLYGMDRTLSGLLDCIRIRKTSFRSYEFLNFKQYIDFASNINELEIDLSMVKSTEPNLNELKPYLAGIQKVTKKNDIVGKKLVTLNKELD